MEEEEFTLEEFIEELKKEQEAFKRIHEKIIPETEKQHSNAWYKQFNDWVTA